MNISDLPMGSAPSPIHFNHFPTRWQAFIWRNWGYVPSSKLAEILQCSEATLLTAAAELGLPQTQKVNPKWRQLGYQTIIRANWHLLNYRQLLQLLEWSPEQLAYTLKEEDFFWIKLGMLKPDCEEIKFAPLTPVEQQATKLFRNRVKKHIHQESGFTYLEEPFAFMEKYSALESTGETKHFELNFIHSYAASCGDIFMDIENRDPIPENLLEQYASMGIKGVWMHAILYLLHPVPGSEEFSHGYETRLQNLAKLVSRCKKYGIGIYLYLNEPRGMQKSFYDKNPDWAGIEVPENQMKTNCTSKAKPLAYLEEACRAVFEAVPDLAGAFLITMSENPTHCNYKFKKSECPLCRDRDGAEIIAQVVAAAEKGIHAAAPKAKLLVSDWAWREHENDTDNINFKRRVIDKLPSNVWVMSVSEWGKETNVGGIKGSVVDYSISQVGPSPESAAVWRYAKARGLKTVAKIQINNSWELSAVPYLPVPYLIEEHLNNLLRLGVDGVMLGWTLGGYPGGNLELLNKDVATLAKDKFSPGIAEKICEVWRQLSDAFKEYPFSWISIYFGPMNTGSMNLLYLEETAYEATMVGYPYDDLTKWRDIYPEDIFEEQFRLLTEKWHNALKKFSSLKGELSQSDIAPYEELRRIAEASYCHLRSSYLQIRFVRQRKSGDSATLLAIVKEELTLVHQLYELVRLDSRIGFEASNHYYYSLNDLIEKMVNCEDIISRLSK